MRYYSIVIKDPANGQTLVFDSNSGSFGRQASGSGVWTYGSLVPGASVTTPGATMPGALTPSDCRCRWESTSTFREWQIGINRSRQLH